MRLFRVRCLALNYLLFWRRMSNGELFRFSIISKNIIIVCQRGFANFIGGRRVGDGSYFFFVGGRINCGILLR